MYTFAGFNDTQLLVFFGSLVRLSTMCATLPFFSHRAIPPFVKILMAFALAMAFYPFIYQNGYFSGLKGVMDSYGMMFMFIAKEVLIGLIVGFVAKMLFESILFAFSYMGLQMGFSFATSFDPTTESNSAVVSQFIFIIAFLLFLAVDGHQFLIRTMLDTFSIIPIGILSIQKVLASYMVGIVQEIFVIAIKLAAPVAVVSFVVNVGFGVIARAVPQINVLILSFTINIMIGLIVIGLLLPVIFESILSVYQLMGVRIYELMRLLGG